jgi:2'-5' RNA ligase
MKKRLFIAIDIPYALRHKLTVLQKEYKAQDNIGPDTSVRISWTPDKNMHITVQFLGWVDENKILNIKNQILKIVQEIRPFNLEFRKIAYAPPGAQKRMIWAMFSESSQYNILVTSINKKMKKYIHPRLWDENVMREERIPHITLARFKNAQIAKNYLLPNTSMGEKGFRVETIYLYESKLSKQGSQYRKLKEFKFSHQWQMSNDRV